MSTEDREVMKCRYFYILLFLIFAEAIFFLYYGLSRHNNYLSSLNDLGHFDQAIWGFFEGFPFLNTDNLNQAVSRLGGHFDPILALFVPFYQITPSVNWLIIAQSVALPLTGLPIYFLALNVDQSERVALMWAAICLTSPFLLSAATNDFHPVSLATPFIALAYLALEKKKSLRLFLSCIFILLCKEHFGLLVMGFGILWYLKHREFKTSLILVLFGGGYFLLVMKVLIPYFSTFDEHSLIVGPMSRYGWLGHSLKDVFVSIVASPIETTRHVLFTMNGWGYLFLLFLSLMGLPLLGIEFLLPGIGDLLANLLSANPMPRAIFSYHSVTLVPVLVVSAIYGSRRFDSLFKRSTLKEPLLVALILGWFFVFSPALYNFWSPKRIIKFHDENYKKIQNIIKPEMSLSVQANIGAHFTQRLEIYRYPNMVGQVDAIILRLESPTTNINNLPDQIKNNRKYLTGSLDNHLQMDRTEYIASIRSLLSDNKYGVLLWDDPWLVLAQGASSHGLEQKLEQKLNRLQKEWKIDGKEQ